MQRPECECTANEAEIFDATSKQTVLESTRYEDVHPINNVSDDTPIEFKIQGSPDEFIDLNNTMLKVKFKVVNAANNNNLDAADNIAPVNNMLSSLFNDVLFTIENTVVEGGDSKYAYKALFSNLLTMSKAVKKQQLPASGYYKDAAGSMNHATVNTGHVSRKAKTNLSQWVTLCGPLLLDMFLQNKYLIPNTSFTLKLTRSNPEFFVNIYTAANIENRTTAVKVIIQEAILIIRRVKAISSYFANIENTLSLQNATYHIQRTKMVTYTIPNGAQSDINPSLFNDIMPKAIFIAFVRNDAYNGVYAQNPFDFQHFNTTDIALHYDAKLIQYKPSFNIRQEYVKEYIMFTQALGLYNKSDDIDISLGDYGNGYTIFAFNLTPDLALAQHAQVNRNGNIRLDIQFTAALNTTVNVIAMGIFDGYVEITKERKVLCDWK